MWVRARSSIQDPSTVATQVENATGLAAIGNFFGRLEQANTWVCVGETILGLILIAVGLARITDAFRPHAHKRWDTAASSRNRTITCGKGQPCECRHHEAATGVHAAPGVAAHAARRPRPGPRLGPCCRTADHGRDDRLQGLVELSGLNSGDERTPLSPVEESAAASQGRWSRARRHPVLPAGTPPRRSCPMRSRCS
jgi:hypothetical protein